MKNSRFQHWLWFGFLLTILPLVLTFWKTKGITHSGDGWLVTFKIVISRGELLLISLAILGSNLGDLFKDECSNATANFTLRSVTFLLCLFAISTFSEINTNINIDKDYANTTSVSVFLCSIVISVVSVITPRK